MLKPDGNASPLRASVKSNGQSDFNQQHSVFEDIAMAPASIPSCGCREMCCRVCVRKWATPLWTSVKAGSGLTVNCMCRMGRSRRHNYTNPLLISGSVGKLTRNDARDVASPRIPNKKTLKQEREARGCVASRRPLEKPGEVRSGLIVGDSHGGLPPCEPEGSGCATCPLDCGWSSRPLAASGQCY